MPTRLFDYLLPITAYLSHVSFADPAQASEAIACYAYSVLENESLS